MANDPNTIQYVIQEDGFWYIASKDRTPGVPGITVSSKGIANGLSTEYNDGYDFGPDSYNPSVTSGVPLTQTSGIQEAVNYVFSNNGGKIILKAGVYTISSTDINKYGNLIDIPTNPATNGNSGSQNVINISIEGEVSGVQWSETSVTDSTSGTIIYVTSSAPTPPTGYYSSIFGVDPNPDNPRYVNNIGLYLDKITIMQSNPATWAAYNLQFCQYVIIGDINAQTEQATLTSAPTSTNAIGVISSMGYTNGIVANIITVVGYYAGILQGTSMTINRLGVFYCVVAIGGPISNPPSDTNYPGHSSHIAFADLQMCSNYLGNSEYPLFGTFVTSLFISILDISDGSSAPFQTSSYIYAPSTLPTNESYIQIIIGWWMNYVASNINIQDYFINQPIENVKILKLANYSSNGGLNPTTPSVPSSGTALQNTNPYSVKAYVQGGAITEIQITIGSNTYTVYSNSTASAVYEGFTLPAGASITLTYTTAPTWSWVPE